MGQGSALVFLHFQIPVATSYQAFSVHFQDLLQILSGVLLFLVLSFSLCGAVFQPLLYCLSASMVLTPRICVSAFRTDVAAVNQVKSTQMASWRAKPSPGSPAGQPTQALLLASQPKLSLPGSGLLLRFPLKSTSEAKLSLLE